MAQPLILIGMFDSPFVRRVAVTLNFLGIPFEHRNWSVGRDFERIREFNPLGRVPTLVLSTGEALMESTAILDHVEELAGPERAFLPASGTPRRQALRIMAMAFGAAEKGVTQVYERAFRPESKRHEPWVERCRVQVHSALAELETLAKAREGRWLIGERMTQADISVVCAFTFLCEALPADSSATRYPSLAVLAQRCEAMEEFRSVKLAFDPPSG